MSVRVQTDVWRHSCHGSTELLVLLKLADNADEDTRLAWPSVEYLAKHCRVSKRTVQRALRSLEESGEITSRPQVGGSTRYRVNLEGGDNLSGGDTGVRGGATQVSPEPSVEPSASSSPSSRYVSIRNEEEELQHVESDDMTKIFDRWRERTGHPRAVLSTERRRLIRRALKHSSVEDCLLAIEGCASDDWYMKRGKFASRDGSRHDKLELILRNRSKIEEFMEKFTQNGNPGGTSSSGHVRIQQAKRNVYLAHDLAGSEEARKNGDEAKRFLAEQGIEVYVGDDGRPAFSE